MSEITETEGNSLELGETEVIDTPTVLEQSEDSKVDDFFDSLDKELNDVVYDTTQSEQATQPQEQSNAPVQAVSENTDVWDNDSNPYKKRYSDSSKEAIRLSEQYKEVEPFVPVLKAMKDDSGLVDHVRDYFESGGKASQTIQQKLELDEDFMFDANDAVSEPDSDSAKVMNAHVDSIVQQRIGQVLEGEKNKAMTAKKNQHKKEEESAFREKTGMSEEDFNTMVAEAKNHKLTLDDIYYVLNRDKNATAVRNSTQREMLEQMQNVRNMPTSNSQANNIGETRNTEEQLFDSIFGGTSTEESLFG
tara:strand:+ start:5565 stop:6479 length:915 start_codon:yes stop_codon:yes gene_type:complete